jgi:hypothetical protein
MDSSTEETLLSSDNRLAWSSGEPTPELGGDVSGVPRIQSFADHRFGVGVPGLAVDEMEWELGNDLSRWSPIKGVAGTDR